MLIYGILSIFTKGGGYLLKFHNFISSRKALIGLIAAFAAALAALLGLWIWLSRSGNPPQTAASQVTTQSTDGQPPSDVPTVPTAPSTDPSTAPSEVPSRDDHTEPTATVPAQPDPTEPTPTEPPATLPGDNSTPGGSGAPPKSDHDEPLSEPAHRPSEAILTYDSFSLYSGQYVEDGRDELVTNVAAILVTNRSGKFLDLATLTFDIDGREALFRVTGLPAGRSAWVLEANRMTATNSSTFTFVDMATGFRDNVISSSDKLSITCVGNMLTATNVSGDKLENVFVYYRVLHSDGNYLGGITYVIDFGTLEPGASIEKLAGHFSAEDARIVRIGWLGQ